MVGAEGATFNLAKEAADLVEPADCVDGGGGVVLDGLGGGGGGVDD